MRRTTLVLCGGGAPALTARLLLVGGLFSPASADRSVEPDGPWPGYTLYAPIFETTTYLVDLDGKVFQRWESEYEPGQSVYLLENGHLLRTAGMGPENRTFHDGGAGGRVQEFTWEGKLVWDLTFSSDLHLLHHDIEPLPNGRVLMIAWERKTRDGCLAAGRDPSLAGEEGLWSDFVTEVWIPEGCPGAGRLLTFNNGRGRTDGDYSSVEEIALPLDARGRYGGHPDLLRHAGLDLRGDSRRPGRGGPRGRGGPGDPGGPHANRNQIFRAHRYALDYPAFEGRDLAPPPD